MRLGRLLLPMLLAAAYPFSVQADGLLCTQVYQIQLRVPENDQHRQFYEGSVSPFYQKQWSLFSKYYREAFWQLKQQGAEEIGILEKLGFQVSADSLIAPDFSTVAKNYEKLLDELKIPEGQRIRPAFTFEHRETKEVMFVIPGRDDGPAPGVGWKVQTVEFRPKGRDVLRALEKGQFPIFSEGLHDLFHLVTFALHPAYAQRLRDGAAALLEKNLKFADFNRSSYYLEVLALANPRLKNEIAKVVLVKDLGDGTTMADFQKVIQTLSKEELIQRAEFWLENFKKYLTSYSAGMSEPVEHGRYVNEIRRDDGWKSDYVDGKHFYRRRILPDELIHESMALMDTYLRRFLETKEESIADGTLQLHLARMEYALWKSSNEVDFAQWAKDTMTKKFNESSKTMQFIRDVFGENSTTYRLFSNLKKK